MSTDVIVVGGGFAGLGAATALAERGLRVAVYEARPALGGRASVFTDPVTGERVDNGQHIVLGCYHETFRFLRRLGTDGAVELQSKLTVDMIGQNGRTSRLSCPSLPAPFHLLAGALGWSALTWRDRFALFHMREALLGSNPVPAARTVREWLTGLRQTETLLEMLWEPLAVAALNQSVDVASAKPFAEVLRRMFGADRSASSLGLFRKPLDEVFAVPSQAFIEARGGQVRTKTPARILTSGNDLRVLVRDEEHRVRAIVCAVPWFALRDAFPDAPPVLEAVLANADATAASPIVTVNLWLDRPVTGAVFIGLPGRTMQWVFDKHSIFGAEASHLSMISSGAETLAGDSNDAIVALALDELRAALPAAREATVRRAVVVREKRSTFSVAPNQPPRPGVRTGIPGVFLAGDWIDTGLPATIESAVVSGHMAADAVTHSLDL